MQTLAAYLAIGDLGAITLGVVPESLRLGLHWGEDVPFTFSLLIQKARRL